MSYLPLLLLSSSRSVPKYFEFKASLISAVHILLYGSHTRNQELTQTSSVKNYSYSAFVFIKNEFKVLRSEYSHAKFAAYAESRFYILHAACFRIRKECY